MKAILRAGAVAALLVLVQACATMESARAPGADLSRIRTAYVEKLPKDDRSVDQMIVAELGRKGIQATSGVPAAAPQDVDAVVIYNDRWMWDITMYMLALNVQVRDGRTRTILAQAHSTRPSLVRRSPEEMVEETLAEIFKK